MSVAGACTSVAVDLGDLEGRHPEILERWAEKERRLMELVDWHGFKFSSEQVRERERERERESGFDSFCLTIQVCLWLRESAELFLQNHTDIGNSAETAEDLLTEHQEFQIRAKVRMDKQHTHISLYVTYVHLDIYHIVQR